MRAFVLSGAGARGPLEIGALAALLEAGLQPDLLVGTSAGAVNACFVAAQGLTFETLDGMIKVWSSVDGADIYEGNLATAAWRLARGYDSLYGSDGLRKLLAQHLPNGVTTFGQLQIPLYVATADLCTGRLFVFGEDGNAPLLEAIMASAAIPIIHPPVDYHGLQLVDGGVIANVAPSIAIDQGATELYVLNAGYGGAPQTAVHGVVNIALRTLETMMGQSLHRDLDHARRDPEILLHHIHLNAFRDVSFMDYGRTAEMAKSGYKITQAYLAAPAPLAAPVPGERPFAGAGEFVHGAREFIPPYL